MSGSLSTLSSLDADSRYVVDICRLTLRLLGDLCPQEVIHRELKARLQPLTGGSETAFAVLQGQATAVETRKGVSPAERATFSAHFGEQAVLELLDEDDLSLGGFAARTDPDDALVLMDVLLAICGHDERISGAERGRLVEAARALDIDDVLLGALIDGLPGVGELRFQLDGERAGIGRAGSCEVSLPDPQVGVLHAELSRKNGAWWVKARSERPVEVDGVAVSSAPLPRDSVLRVGPYHLQLDGGELVARSTRGFQCLRVSGLQRRIDDRVLLDDVSFAAFSGEVVAIVGPSGAGKTTLLDAISGNAPADAGTVRFGGHDFHALRADDPSILGVVPQDDLVLPALTVEESLRASARLRRPPGTAAAELDAVVDRVLDELDIAGIRGQRIGDPVKRGISGGQRKRVNVGQALVSRDPRVLFLDEPTSGLDPRAALGVARLARTLADHDRLVLLVTHDLTPQVIAQVDHLLVLAPGGRLAWFGPPAEALTWFGVDSPDGLFDRLDRDTPTAWAERYAESDAARRLVRTRLRLLRDGAPEPRPAPAPPLRRFLSQLATLTRRNTLVKARDPVGLAVLVAQPVLLALTMLFVFKAATVHLLFMMTLSSLWFGMSAGVRELIVDRAVWRRERQAGVGTAAYVLSKLAVLGPVVAVQCAALVLLAAVGIGSGELGLVGHGFSLLQLAGLCAVEGLVGLGLGMLLSALFRSSEAAVGTLVLLLVPQIAFSGIMIPIHHMGAMGRALTWVTFQRWALDGALQCGEDLHYVRNDTWFSTTTRGFRYALGFRGEGDGAPLVAIVGVLLAWAVGLVVVAGLRVWARERPEAGG